MQKHYYIKNIEKQTRPLSKLSVTDTNLTSKNLDITKYTIMFMESDYNDFKADWKEVILKTKSGFYLYIKKHSLYKISIDIDVYYLQEQHNELLIYLKSFINSLTN